MLTRCRQGSRACCERRGVEIRTRMKLGSGLQNRGLEGPARAPSSLMRIRFLTAADQMVYLCLSHADRPGFRTICPDGVAAITPV